LCYLKELFPEANEIINGTLMTDDKYMYYYIKYELKYPALLGIQDKVKEFE
jgi:hypothetical protein